MQSFGNIFDKIFEIKYVDSDGLPIASAPTPEPVPLQLIQVLLTVRTESSNLAERPAKNK